MGFLHRNWTVVEHDDLQWADISYDRILQSHSRENLIYFGMLSNGTNVVTEHMNIVSRNSDFWWLFLFWA